jgi:hypothetical protein
MLRQFTIDEQYICDVTVRKQWGMYDHISCEDLTPEQLVKILKGEDRCSSISNKDHDEFTKLRNQLEELGYIKTERSWWNGDRVLKRFKLNEWTFIKGEKFCSAGAMKNSINCARQFGWKRIAI